MCQDSNMLRIQSDGPQRFAQSSAALFVPSAGGGSRADLIVCTSKCTLHYQRAASLRVTKKATYLAIANWLISLAQIS